MNTGLCSYPLGEPVMRFPWSGKLGTLKALLTHLWVLNLKCKWAEISRSLPLSGDLIQDKEESRQSSSWQLVWALLYLIKKMPCSYSHLPPEAKLRHVDGRPPAGSRAAAPGASQQCTWQLPLVNRSHHWLCPGTTRAPHCWGRMRCETQHITGQWHSQKMMGVNHTDLDNSNPLKELVSTTPVLKSGSWRLLFFIQTAAELLFNTKSQNNC